MASADTIEVENKETDNNNTEVKKEKEENKGPDALELENYIIGNALGKGAFGKVFLITEKITGKQFALKECVKTTLISRKCAHLVLRERHVLSRMDYHFIIKLHRAFQGKIKLYFVMDYMPNGTINEQYMKYGAFRNEVTRFYSAEVIMALEYLRTQRIVHRDLKMANVLLDQNYHIKLIDFGLCVQLEPTEIGARRSLAKGRKQFNPKIGTMGYHAPEILDELGVTYGTDLWCLGLMIYEFHVGDMAFDIGINNYRFIRAAKYRAFPAGSDPQIMDLVKKLLVKDPKRRLGIDDMDRLKTHSFYGCDDPEDWKKLHTLKPPPFDPNDKKSRTDEVHQSYGTFGPNNDMKTGPYQKPPQEFMDWEALETPPLPAAIVDVDKCCIVM